MSQQQRCESSEAWFGMCDVPVRSSPGYYRSGVGRAVVRVHVVHDNGFEDDQNVCEQCMREMQMHADDPDSQVVSCELVGGVQ